MCAVWRTGAGEPGAAKHALAPLLPFAIPARQRHDAAMAPPTIPHALVLPIAPEHWPPPRAAIEIDGVPLAPKPELHVTLVGRALGAELHAAFGDRAEGLVAAARDAHDWGFKRRGDWLLLRKPLTVDGHAVIAHSLVERVDLPAMAPFHRALGRLLGRQLPLPPPHVTLYTAGRAQGIGVSSPARLRAFAVRHVTAAELA